MKTMLKKTIETIWKYCTWNNCAVMAAMIIVIDMFRDPRTMGSSWTSKSHAGRYLNLLGWGFLAGMAFVLSLYKYWDYERVKAFGLSVRKPKKNPTYFGTRVGAIIMMRPIGSKQRECFEILSLNKFRIRYCPVGNQNNVFELDQSVFAHQGWEPMPNFSRDLEPGDIVRFKSEGSYNSYLITGNDEGLKSVHFMDHKYYDRGPIETMPYDLFDRLDWIFHDRMEKGSFEKYYNAELPIRTFAEDGTSRVIKKEAI
jgi:hypothetical protein